MTRARAGVVRRRRCRRDLRSCRTTTAGVNAVLRSLDLDRHDELLVTTHEYNASRNALEYVAGIAGAKVIAIDAPFPIASSDVIVQRALAVVTDRTRLLLYRLRHQPRAIGDRGQNALHDLVGR